jgi:imidazoleglycerol-phosphate dehydratase
MRSAQIKRKTREARVHVTVALDGKGVASNRTGVRFLDHMLNTFATHSFLDLEVKAAGDLQHHVVEDVALTLGTALNRALGDRVGINRFGHAIVPMDEALALAAVDLARRPFASIQLQIERAMLEDTPREDLEHFFSSLIISLNATVHLRVLEGRNDHHKVEAAVKAFASAFGGAIVLGPRRSSHLPSAKGMM